MKNGKDVLKAEVDRLNKIVAAYGVSARVIALYLKKFCDPTLPYAEMIADAARKADKRMSELEKNLNAAETCIDAVDDAERRGSSNDWVREAIDEYNESQKTPTKGKSQNE